MSQPALRAESSSARARRLRADERRIVAGLVVSLVLAIVSGAVSVWRSVEARERLLSVTVDEAQLVQLISETGRDVSRLRGAALEQSLVKPTPYGVTPPSMRLPSLQAELERRLQILDPLLEARGHGLGEGLRGSFIGFRHAVDRFQEASQGGSEEARSAALEQLLAYASRIQATIDALLVESNAGSARSLNAMNREFTELTDLEIVLSLMVVAGLLAVWMGVLRTSRNTSRVLNGYVDRIEEANRDLDAFAGRVAHDFRNVLAPLPLMSARMKRGRVPDLRAAAEQLDRVAHRGDSLISGLLAFSRLGNVEEDFSTSLRAAIVDVLDELEPLVKERRAKLAVDLEDLEVTCSPALLHMVLSNLISNAVKYLGDTTTREVSVQSRRQERGALVTVKDTGPGISSEHLAQLFEPFFRVPGTGAEGTGLGLPTVKRIVEALGGRVTITSRPGAGTTATVWLPANARVDRPTPRASKQPSHLSQLH